MIAEMIWQMISVMVVEVFDDYYCLWVWMSPMGPGVMYEMVVAGQSMLSMGMIMVSGELLWTFCMMIEILHEHLCGKV